MTRFVQLSLLVVLVWIAWSLSRISQPVEHLDLVDFVDLLVDAGFGAPDSPADTELLEKRTIVLASDVNAASAQRVMTALLLLNSRDSDAPIDLYLRTEGGFVSDAFSVIDVMEAIDAPVNTHAVGGAHSAGAMILTAGTGRRYAYPQASVMFHGGLYEDDGEFGGNQLDNQRITNFWRDHAHLPADWLEVMEDRTYFLSPELALEYDIVDEVRRQATARAEESATTTRP